MAASAPAAPATLRCLRPRERTCGASSRRWKIEGFRYRRRPARVSSAASAALNVRPQLRQRFRGGSERAIANVDLFLEMARAYDVRGLRAFARDMRANWTDAVRQVEGRPDAEENAVALVTVHAAKGLE